MKKKDRPYSVEPYNPKWVKKYKEEEKRIKNILGDKVLKIEHIGSTSVEGMWAKPQIDILVIVDDIEKIRSYKKKFEMHGFNYQEKFEEYNERYFTKDAKTGERLVSVHIREEDHPQAVQPIYFRDYLRSHPEAVKRYSKVKREAYKKGVNREEYPREKREVLNDILRKAKKWYENEDKKKN